MAKLSYSQAIRETIAQEMQRDERVFVMGEDVEKLGGVYGCTRDLYKEFGTERVRLLLQGLQALHSPRLILAHILANLLHGPASRHTHHSFCHNSNPLR